MLMAAWALSSSRVAPALSRAPSIERPSTWMEAVSFLATRSRAVFWLVAV
jgi:hypothetical protein